MISKKKLEKLTDKIETVPWFRREGYQKRILRIAKKDEKFRILWRKYKRAYAMFKISEARKYLDECNRRLLQLATELQHEK